MPNKELGPSTLREMKLLKEFADRELNALIDLAELREVTAGHCIVRQDETGHSMYLLVEGKANVTHRREGQSFHLATLEPGDFFGELALIDEGPRSADVEAVSDCKLLALSGGSLRALAGVYPNAAFKFLIAVSRVLVQRMRHSNRKYIDSLMVQADG